MKVTNELILTHYVVSKIDCLVVSKIPIIF